MRGVTFWGGGGSSLGCGQREPPEIAMCGVGGTALGFPWCVPVSGVSSGLVGEVRFEWGAAHGWPGWRLVVLSGSADREKNPLGGRPAAGSSPQRGADSSGGALGTGPWGGETGLANALPPSSSGCLQWVVK